VRWSDVSVGGARQPTIVIDDEWYPDDRGVQFRINGVIDDRDPVARPNGFDATGPQENSKYHIWPSVTLSAGDVLEGRWVDRSGQVRKSTQVVAAASSDSAAPAPAPAPASPVSSGDMGPSGQWPAGFPTYGSAATIVTNGTMFGLLSALDSLPGGGVIEHAGPISGDIRRASGSDPILIRPPHGKRDEFKLGALDIRSSGVLLAGFRQTSKVHVHNSVNSGLAWTELNANTEIRGMGYTAGQKTRVLVYEVIARQPKPAGGDRIVAHAQKAGAQTNIDIVGSWLTGSHNSGAGDHADTVQVILQNGGAGFVNIADSVIWPSDDKALQGEGFTPVYRLVNSWIASPSAARALWPTLNVTGYNAITAVADVVDSVLSGTVHGKFPVRVSGSTIGQDTARTVVDAGGNTTVAAPPAPPAAPTPEQLDLIWHR
jgi:hypothetical protein